MAIYSKRLAQDTTKVGREPTVVKVCHRPRHIGCQSNLLRRSSMIGCKVVSFQKTPLERGDMGSNLLQRRAVFGRSSLIPITDFDACLAQDLTSQIHVAALIWVWKADFEVAHLHELMPGARDRSCEAQAAKTPDQFLPGKSVWPSFMQP